MAYHRAIRLYEIQEDINKHTFPDLKKIYSLLQELTIWLNIVII